MTQVIPYILQLYQQEGVADRCLQLQDDWQADIPFLLFLCWHGRYHGRLPAEQADRLLAHSTTVSTHTVQPLRRVRRWMKQGWPAQSTLRETIKKAELQAELALLSELQERCVKPEPRQAEVHDNGSAIADNLQDYLSKLPAMPPAAIWHPLVEAAIACNPAPYS